MIQSNGSNSAWFNASGNSVNLDLSDYEHFDVVRIQYEVSIGNLSLVNISFSSFYIYDSEGPQLSSTQQYSLANGSIIPLSFQTLDPGYPCSFGVGITVQYNKRTMPQTLYFLLIQTTALGYRCIRWIQLAITAKD